MNMPGMQNKMPGMSMMPAQSGGPMSHMGPIQTMQNNPMLTQMNQMAQGNMPQQMNQIVPGQMNQLATGQMQQNMQVCVQSLYAVSLELSLYVKNLLFLYEKLMQEIIDFTSLLSVSSRRCKISCQVRWVIKLEVR